MLQPAGRPDYICAATAHYTSRPNVRVPVQLYDVIYEHVGSTEWSRKATTVFYCIVA